MGLIHDLVRQLTEEIHRLVPPDPPAPVFTRVPAGGDLRGALQQGGNIELEPGAVYDAQQFEVRSGTYLRANGATLIGTAGPAVYVRPGSRGVRIDDLTALSAYTSVVQLGDNVAATQGTTDAVPTHIQLTRLRIPTHRRRRGLEVNCADFEFVDCEIDDVWDEAGRNDSQAILFANTPGRGVVRGGRLVAASENVMFGGDTMKVPGQVISDVLLDGITFTKPLQWQTDGIARTVKNLLEFKAGVRLRVANCLFENCWRAAQDGWAWVITPRNAQYIADLLIEDCRVRNVAGGVQLLGRDTATVTPEATARVTIRRCDLEVSRAAAGGGRGIFALVVGGVRDVTCDAVTFHGDGSSLVLADAQEIQGPFIFHNSPRATVGAYGVQMPGANYGDPVTDLRYINRQLLISLAGNTFVNAPRRFQQNFPDNQYVTA